MKVKCQETDNFLNSSNNFSSVSKGMENILSYTKGYLDRTTEYVDKLKALNSKYPSKDLQNNISPIEEFFRRLRIVVEAKVTSLYRFNKIVDNELKKCEKLLSEQIECQKRFKKEVADAEEDYCSQLKDIEKAKRNYHSDASSLEDTLKTLEKKKRGSFKIQSEDDLIDNINKYIKNLTRSEKEYTKQMSKSQRYKQTFIDRVNASTGSSLQLFEEIERVGKETVVNLMVYLKMAEKELIVEIDTYSLDMEKPILLEQHEDIPKSSIDCLPDSSIEPYKIKLFNKEQTEDLSDEEVHNVIKTMYENMKLKAFEYDIDFEGRKVKLNVVIKKMLAFSSDLRLTKEDQQLIELYLKEKRFRDVFLQKLNDLRNHGEFMWPIEHYYEVGRVLRMILTEIIKEIEIDTAKNVIILSQTFYYKDTTNKVYLQSFIQDHLIFKQKEFWENLLLKSIENEMKDYTKINKRQKISIKETEEENKMKLSNIVFSQVVPLTDNMVGFNILKEDIHSILDNVFAKYEIDKSHKELVMSVLDKKEPNNSPNSEQIEVDHSDEMIKPKNEANHIRNKP